MRAEIGALTAQQHKLERLVDQERRGAADNAEAIEVIAQILGRHFAGLPPQDSRVSRRAGQLVRMQAYDQLRSFNPREVTDLVMCTIIDLETFDLTAHLEPLRQMMHLRVQSQSGEWAYAVSRAAIENMPPDHLAREIGRTLAISILRQLPRRAA